MLSAQSVADYLEQNPSFFEQHIALLARLHLPHPHGGRTVSIAERQVLALRDQARALEQKVEALVAFGHQNDALGDKVHALACQLLACGHAPAIAEATHASLANDFAVPAVALRFWAFSRPGSPPGATFEAVDPDAQEAIAALEAPRVGAEAPAGTASWFGPEATALKSFALIPLRTAGGATLGAIALGAKDADRFHADQGTQHLSRIGTLVACALASLPQADA